MATIKIMSGGAPKEVFAQLTPEFEKRTGHKVEFAYAVMSALRDRIAKGENADVLVMPTNLLDGYQQSGLVSEKGRGVLGLVSVHAVVRSGASKPDLSTPEKVKQVLLNSRAVTHATPGATPSGTHMGKLMEKLGIAEAMKDKIIHRPALDGGVQLVASGEADIGFYPKSEVVNIEGLTVADGLPEPIQQTTIYGAAVMADSAAPDAGAAFIAFMCEPAHSAVWVRGGFDMPS